MSIALETQLSVDEMFKKNRELLLIEAHIQFPDETSENALSMLQRKYIDEQLTEKISKAMYDLVDMTNGLSYQELSTYFLNGLLKQHHHSQEQFWNTMLHLMKKYANAEERHFDGRNENARKMCAEIYVQWLAK